MKVCPQCGGTYSVAEGFCPMDGARLLDAGRGHVSAGHEDDGAEQLVGEVLDRRYRLDQVIGQGGMAYVYRATHTLIGKTIAVKVLRPDLVHDADVVRRFLQEARLASSVKHPNVVDISDYGELPQGGAFYVMEHLRGRTLAQRIREEGAMKPVEALAVALQICHGLEAAHEQNIVHRDLKPENVFLCGDKKKASGADPRVKLLDFGIARIGPRRVTAAGAVLGTPTYMAPEQAQGAEVDLRADLYSLGVMLFEMLVGWVPFKNDDVAVVLYSHIHTEPPRLSAAAPRLSNLPKAEEVVADLLAKKADERPPTAATVRERLTRALQRDLAGGSQERMLKSTLSMGSGGLGEGGQAAAAKSPEGLPLKQRPMDWGKTERHAGVVGPPAKPAPRSPGDLDPTPIAPPTTRTPNLPVILTGTALVAALTTFGLYTALAGFPTSGNASRSDARPLSEGAAITPAAPTAGTAPAASAATPAALEVAPSKPASKGAATGPQVAPSGTPGPEGAADRPSATGDPSQPDAGTDVKMDPKPDPKRSGLKARRPKRSKQTGATQETPGKSTDTPSTGTDPAAPEPTRSKPPAPPPPSHDTEGDSRDLKDPFDAN